MGYIGTVAISSISNWIQMLPKIDTMGIGAFFVMAPASLEDYRACVLYRKY
ncbi:Aspartyl/glutamyl-tRNA(Asn/Gln) amidotransferase subunit C [Frankliniella fusca]|uniref:Aspartyl/glutamyl-tRNA(Asn/Gln) amidotransferase subunit C n=1 Tax=Frankliniella fusca TaxID=407009 RepID=A0AAE1I045_9NEOP|nr:Aspartyl/glutamyl-tRNA(Asn/Gln) amidotransferase subunit C [Frankliniella fusca]